MTDSDSSDRFAFEIRDSGILKAVKDNDLSEASALLEKISPSNIYRSYFKGLLLQCGLQFAGAVKAYTESLETLPDRLPPVIKMIECYREIGNYHMAMDQAELSLNKFPSNPLILYQKALTSLHMGHAEECENIRDELAESQPELAEKLNNAMANFDKPE